MLNANPIGFVVAVGVALGTGFVEVGMGVDV
jgi:hypothetical protein